MNSTYRERIEKLWSAYGQPGTMEDFVSDTLALIQEVAKSAKPEIPRYPVEDKDLQMLHDGAVQGYQDGIDQYEQNIKELLGGSSE